MRASNVAVMSAVILVSCAGTVGPVAPTSTTTPVAANSSADTSAPQVDEQRIPIDGRPDELGVASIDFITALFPTSPDENRGSAAWRALRYNAEQLWVEECVAEHGFVFEAQRTTALAWRRNADMPDFELDARLGLYERGLSAEEMAALQAGPQPPAGSSAAEAEAWEAAMLECDLRVEEKRSEQFDQVIGRAPSWWDIVREVNASETMAGPTEQLLNCVADGEGPRVDRVHDLYLHMDRVRLDAETREEAEVSVNSLAVLIADCAGDYNQVRQELLIPKRDAIVDGYRDVLAEAEQYFNEVTASTRDG